MSQALAVEIAAGRTLTLSLGPVTLRGGTRAGSKRWWHSGDRVSHLVTSGPAPEPVVLRQGNGREGPELLA